MDEPKKKEPEPIDWGKLITLVVSAIVTAVMAYFGTRAD